MRLSETKSEYCIEHGYQEFFLGEVWEYEEYFGTSLHCPHCFPDHPDNPEVIARKEKEEEELLNSCMAL